MAFFLAGLFSGPALHAQQTITYSDGETNAAPIVITAGTTDTLSLSSGDAVQSGPVSETAPSGNVAVDAGTGTIALTGSNTYTGDTTIDFGTLQVAGNIGDGYFSGNFNVGSENGDSGTLLVSPGGYILDQNGDLGLESGATGMATISGGSWWSSSLVVGDSGTGTVTVQNGGFLLANQTSVIGNNSGSSGEVIVAGAGSSANTEPSGFTANNLTIGNSGTGAVTVEDGAQMEVTGYYLILGNNAGSSGSLTVSGIGTNGYDSRLDANVNEFAGGASFIVGNSGAGTLNIEDGGIVSGGTQLVAGNNSGSNGVITVTGANLNINGVGDSAPYSDLDVGYVMVGASGVGFLNVTDGGEARIGELVVGANAGSSGTVTVSGVNADGLVSKLTADNAYVGVYGTGVLNVDSGGTLPLYGAGTINLASNPGSNGTLNIGNGGASGLVEALVVVGGLGTAIVNFGETDTDTFTPQLSGSLSVVQSGTGTTVLTAANNYTGGTTVDFGALAVTGTGASIDHPSAVLYVGANSGDNGSVIVSGGAQVTTGGGSGTEIGFNTGATGNLTITGVGTNGTASTLSTASSVTVGAFGTGALNVTDGGQVSISQSADIILGEEGGASGSLTVSGVNASGTASSLAGVGPLYVGEHGQGNLLVSDGGQLSSQNSLVGMEAGSVGTATVTGVNANGTASTWSLGTNDLEIGLYGSGTLSILNGGQVLDDFAALGVTQGSVGTAIVSGVNAASGKASTWNNSFALVVGVGYAGSPNGYGGSGTLTVASGGVVTTPEVVVAGGISANDAIAQGGPAVGVINVDSGGILQAGRIVSGGGSSNATLNINGGILEATNSYSSDSSAPYSTFLSGFGAGQVTLQSGGGTIDNGSYAITIDSPLGGIGALTATGSGTTTLAVANTYTGGTTLNGGDLALGSTGAIGTTGTISFTGGTLQYTSANTTDYSNRFSSAPEQLYSMDTNGQSVTFATALDSIGGSLNKDGSGTLTLTASGAYTGATIVNAGTLALGSGGSIASSSGVNLAASGATFDISQAGNQTIGDLSGVAGSTVNLGANTLTLGTANSTTFSGVIAADGGDRGSGGGTGGGIDKIGSGTLTLIGDNTYTGNTTIDFGTLAVAGKNADINSGYSSLTYVGYNNGDNGNLMISNGGQVSDSQGVIGGESLDSTGNATVTGSGSSWSNRDYLIVASGTLTISSGGQVSDNQAYVGYLGNLSGGKVTVTGTGSSWNSGGLDIGFDGIGSLVVSSGGQVSDQYGNLFQGDATVTGTGSSWSNSIGLYVGLEGGSGTLTVSSGGVVQVDGGSGTLSLAQDLGSHGTLNIGNCGASGTVEAAMVTGGAGTAVVNFDETDSSYTFAPQLTGTLSVNQIGSGTTILTAANTFTGTTSIAAGTLAVDGSTASGNVVNVSTAGTLAGTGTINGATTLTGKGVIDLGSSGTIANTLTVTGGNWNGLGTVTGLVSINAGTQFSIASTGNLTADGGVDVSSGATFILSGGEINTQTSTFTNGGQVSGFGTLSTGGLTNNGNITLTTGLTTVNGSVNNSSTGTFAMTKKAEAVFTGNVINNGTFHATSAQTTFEGSFTNNGAYISDPSTSNFTNLTIGTNGYLQGGAGDVFNVSGNLTNNSTNSLFNISQATLDFQGAVNHTVTWSGATTLNFEIGTLELDAGGALTFDLTAGTSLYVTNLDLSGGAAQLEDITDNGGGTLYYNPDAAGNAYLNGQTYALAGGGYLEAGVAAPEPSTYSLLLSALGLLGLRGFFARRQGAKRQTISQ